jgi:hypothetical protein
MKNTNPALRFTVAEEGAPVSPPFPSLPLEEQPIKNEKMAIEVRDNGASLKIINNNVPRFIMKSQIIEVEVVKTTIVKIDIGLGVLYNVYVDQTQVTVPTSSSAADLRDQIMAMLQDAGGGSGTTLTGYALEQTQLENKQQIILLKDAVSALSQTTSNMNDKIAFPIKIVDETNPNVKYEGYAQPGARPEQAVWAIQKIANNDGIITYEWAMGNKNFDKVWDARLTFTYS